MANASRVSLNDYGFTRCFVEVSSVCNMACAFCNHPFRQWEKRKLDFSLVQRIIHELADGMRPTEVGFNVYNEPLLYKDLFKCLDECRTYDLPTQIVTNGLLLTGKNVQRLLEHQPTNLRISLQVVDAAKHNEVRGCMTPYSTYIENMAKSVAALHDQPNAINVRIDVAISRRYSGYRALLMRLGCYDPGDSSVRFQKEEHLISGLNAFLRKVEGYSDSFKFDPTQLESAVRESFLKPSDTSLLYTLSDRMQINQKEFFSRDRQSYKPVEYGSCQSGDLCVLSNGVVTPCCMDPFGKIVMGNAKTTSLRDILEKNKRFLRNLREGGRIEHPLCRRCLGAPSALGAGIKNAYNRLRMRKR